MKPAVRTLAAALWRTLDSVGGRTFILLTLGITAAAVLSATLAEGSRRRDFEALRTNQLVDRAFHIQQRWMAARTPEAREAAVHRLLGVKTHQAAVPFKRDVALEAKLVAAMGARFRPTGGRAPSAACLPHKFEDQIPSQLGDGFVLKLDCWVVSFTPPGEPQLTFGMFQPPLVMSLGSGRNPIYLLALLAASAALSVLVARFVTLPLRHLTEAARAFAESLDAEDARVRGPTEVKAALSTFNIMQARVRAGLHERTQLLAAISHDLQTPLTRLRLRLEQVDDDALRERLVSDVNATQALVREGLDLARSHESREPWSVVDLDSLVESLAEDAAEFGSDVRFLSGCGVIARVKPNALARALNNLIDNAVAYGGSAELSCRLQRNQVVICIRDHGPGLSEPDAERLFEPFVRGQAPTLSSRRSTGIGLTIARAQAAASGATVQLANAPSGGLIAWITLQALEKTPTAQHVRTKGDWSER